MQLLETLIFFVCISRKTRSQLGLVNHSSGEMKSTIQL